MKNAIVYIVTKTSDTNIHYQNFLFSVSSLINNTNLTNIDIWCITNQLEYTYINVNNSINYLLLDDIQNEIDLSILKLENTNNYTYLRLIIPLIQRFQIYNNILYLDNDTEILSDISTVINSTFTTGSVLGIDERLIWGGDNSTISNTITNYIDTNNIQLSLCNDLSKFYINAGVVLININNILKQYSYQTLQDIMTIEHHLNNPWPCDQRVINNYWKLDHCLDKKYNVFYNIFTEHNNIFYSDMQLSDCAIIHYTEGNDSKTIFNNKVKNFINSNYSKYLTLSSVKYANDILDLSDLTIIPSNILDNVDKTALRKIILNNKCPIKIEKYAFSDCINLQEVWYSEYASIIEEYAFYNCRSLKKIVFSSNGVTIGDYAFQNCHQLYDLWYITECKYIGKNAFINTRLDEDFDIIYTNSKIHKHIISTSPYEIIYK